MYYDISLPSHSLLDLTHLINSLDPTMYSTVAIDYEYSDIAVAPVPESFSKLKNEHKKVTLYSRATLSIEQTATLHQLNQTQDNGYDLMAVRPKNQKIFHSLCVQYDNYDVISLDMSVKLPFMLKRNPVYEALRKGKYFEMQYGPMFDDNTRVVCMTNMINLIKATGGKNLIVSSNAKNTYLHRTPYDVAALLTTLGLNKQLALAAMKQNPENLVKSSIHRKYFKSTIQELPVAVVTKLGKRIKKHRQKLSKLSQKSNEMKQ